MSTTVAEHEKDQPTVATQEPAAQQPRLEGTPEPSRTETMHRERRGLWIKTLAIAGALVAALSLMFLAFANPMIHSGADHLPLAISGPEAAVSTVNDQLESTNPGAFQTTTYDSADEVQAAVEDREAVGGLSLSQQGVTITTATGAGTPYVTILQQIGAGLEQSGQDVTYQDVAPTTGDDPNGLGLGALALPTVFGGMISGVLLSTLLKNRPLPKIVGSLTVAILGGAAIAAILQFGFHATDGNYWLLAGAVSLGIASVSLTILGLESVFGAPGLGLGAITMMFISNPLAGTQAGQAWLPHPWGEFGQVLPLGAASTLARSAAYFDGAGAGAAITVLTCWVVLGLALILLGASRRPSSKKPKTA